MEVVLKTIEEREFIDSKLPTLFDDGLTSRCFGVLKDNEHLIFKLGWRSDLVAPIVTIINEGLLSVGIDQNWALIDVRKKSILINLSLTYNFLATEVYKGNILIASELEITRIDKASLDIVKTYALPERFEAFLFIGENVQVQCSNSEIIPLY